MDIREYFRLLRLHWVTLFLLTVFGAASGVALAYAQPPPYEAKSEMIVTASSRGSDLEEDYQGALLAQKRAQAYTPVLTSDAVLNRLIKDLNLPYSPDRLRGEIRAANPAESAAINVAVEDRSPQRAKAIADGLGPALSATINEAESSDSSVRVTTLDPGSAVARQVPRSTAFNAALGGALGLLVGLVWSVLRELSNRRVRDAEDLMRACDVPVLGVVRGRQAIREMASLPGGAPSEVVEGYRLFALNLQSRLPESGDHSYAVASPRGGDGAPCAAVGLAIALAHSGQSVILVDADLTSPSVARLLKLSGPEGLTDVLTGRLPLDSALQEWREGVSLRVLAGPESSPGTAPAPTVLRQNDLIPLCEELEQRADAVIFASPPVLTGADAVLLARVAGQAVIVADQNKTLDHEVRRAVHCLRNIGAPVLGTALFGATHRRDRMGNGAFGQAGYDTRERETPPATPHTARERAPASAPFDPDHKVAAVSGSHFRFDDNMASKVNREAGHGL